MAGPAHATEKLTIPQFGISEKAQHQATVQTLKDTGHLLAQAAAPTPPMPQAPDAPQTAAPALAPSLTDDTNEGTFSDLPEEGEEEDAAAKPKPERQKTYSFLGGENGSYNDFDYGAYYLRMRKINDLKIRLGNSIETARELKMDIPLGEADKLLLEANQYKSRFEGLFLSGHTQEAEKEYTQARQLLFKAVGMTSASPKVEGRAIWLDRGSIVEAGSPDGLRQLLGKLHQAGINIIYFETLNAGYPVYPSKYLKSNPLIQGWDPLRVAVDEGHKLGMEVHAWVWTFAVGNIRHNLLLNQSTAYPGPILSEAGLMSEALRNGGGGLSAGGTQYEYWLSPASPRARQFLLNIYKEIVSNYNVDGLQLDYIRYPFQNYAGQMGFEAVGRQHFESSTGLSLDKLDDNTRKVWIAWKTYQVSSFVKEVSQTLKGIRPGLKLSAAVFPLTRANRIAAIQQDWETWIDNGWIDTLSPMSYTTSPKRLQRIYEYVSTATQKRALIYPGIAINRLDPVELLAQVEALREKGGMGSTLFAMAHLDASKVDALGSGPYKEHASIPPHRQPVKAIQSIVEEYQGRFGNLDQQTPASLQQAPAIKQQLALLANALARLDAATLQGKVKPASLEAIQTSLTGLETATKAWGEQEQAVAPFRAQYFSQLTAKMRHLLDYMADHTDAASPSSATAPVPQAG